MCWTLSLNTPDVGNARWLRLPKKIHQSDTKITARRKLVIHEKFPQQKGDILLMNNDSPLYMSYRRDNNIILFQPNIHKHTLVCLILVWTLMAYEKWIYTYLGHVTIYRNWHSFSGSTSTVLFFFWCVWQRMSLMLQSIWHERCEGLRKALDRQDTKLRVSTEKTGRKKKKYDEKEPHLLSLHRVSHEW